MLQAETDAIIHAEESVQSVLKLGKKLGGNVRKKSVRRRLVDPTTTDRLYSPAEWEFMRAMELYKLRSCRMFPTWSEALEVLLSLGYRKNENVSTAA